MKYEDLTLNQYCNILYAGFEKNPITESDMYHYLSHLTNEFDHCAFDYVIKDIRSYAEIMSICDSPKTNSKVDFRTGFQIYKPAQDTEEFSVQTINNAHLEKNGTVGKSDFPTNFSQVDKLQPLELNLKEYNPISFCKDASLKERIHIISNKISNVQFLYGIHELILFSELSEKEFNRSLEKHIQTSMDTENDLPEDADFQETILPKFNTTLSEECLIKIMRYLKEEKWLINPNCDNWLFWFNLKTVQNPTKLVWKGSPTMLSNIIQHLCGECISNTMKIAFGVKKHVKPTQREYKKGVTYKRIKQIITANTKING